MIMYNWVAVFTAIVIDLNTGAYQPAVIDDIDSVKGFSAHWQCVRHVRFARPRMQRVLQAYVGDGKIVSVAGYCRDTR